MPNPGNTGHRGYKMSKIVDFYAQGKEVVTILECGHTTSHVPYQVQFQGMDAAQYVEE